MSALLNAKRSQPGLLKGLPDHADAELRDKIEAGLRTHRRVMVFKPAADGALTVELHTKRGRESVWQNVSIATALAVIDDVSGSGEFGAVLHVDTPPALVQRLELVHALVTTPAVGSVQ